MAKTYSEYRTIEQYRDWDIAERIDMRRGQKLGGRFRPQERLWCPVCGMALEHMTRPNWRSHLSYHQIAKRLCWHSAGMLEIKEVVRQ